jgi:hypothetical protein
MLWKVWRLLRTMALREALWVFDKHVIITQPIISYWFVQSLFVSLGYQKRPKGNRGRGQAPCCEGFEGQWL